ncbi:hypothetical protein FQN60_002303, partial [Etheostoma spectabile]
DILLYSAQDLTRVGAAKEDHPAPQPPPDGAEQLDDRMGIVDHTSKAPTESQQQETEEAVGQPKESSPVPGTWSPLLTNVCLCTVLALSAYHAAFVNRQRLLLRTNRQDADIDLTCGTSTVIGSLHALSEEILRRPIGLWRGYDATRSLRTDTAH